MMINPMIPTLLAFDLDGVTHDVAAYKDRQETNYRELSKSAEESIFYDEKGLCDWYTDKKTRTIYKMRAISREKFKEIFDRVHHIRRVHGDKSPISIVIITKGDFTKDDIMHCWDQFYGDDDKRFSGGVIPIEFFNRKSFKDRYGQPLKPDAPDSDYDKGLLMHLLFPEWRKGMPGLTRKRVFLIDDYAENRKSARMHGFSVIKFPTTIRNRKKGVTFTTHGPIAFAKMHRVIDEAVGEVKEENRTKEKQPLIKIQKIPAEQEAHCQTCLLF